MAFPLSVNFWLATEPDCSTTKLSCRNDPFCCWLKEKPPLLSCTRKASAEQIRTNSKCPRLVHKAAWVDHVCLSSWCDERRKGQLRCP